MGMTIGFTSEIKEKLRFSLYFARFALSLQHQYTKYSLKTIE